MPCSSSSAGPLPGRPVADAVAVQLQLVAFEGHRDHDSSPEPCIPEVEGGRPRRLAGAADLTGGLGAPRA